MTALTETDIAAVRKADALCVSLMHRDGAIKGNVRLIKRAHKSRKDAFPHDVEHHVAWEVSATATTGNGVSLHELSGRKEDV